VKIYLAAVGALRKKQRQDETEFITKIGHEYAWFNFDLMLQIAMIARTESKTIKCHVV
jgi:hypothetical protein